MTGVGAVLFDLDGTLHDRAEAFRIWATEFVAARLGSQVEGERQNAAEWLVAADMDGYCPRSEFAARVRARFPAAVAEPVDVFVDSFRAGLLSHVRLADGAEALLDALAARSVPGGIVTNGSTRQHTRKVERLGLSGRASCVLIPEEFGAKEPHPDVFLAAARKLDAEPRRTLFVGDHLQNDILGARAVGMKTAWLRLGREWPQEHTGARPDLIVDGLAEVVACL